MIDPASVKLGKLAPRHDPRTLRLEQYVDVSALPPIPTTRAWDKGITNFGYMRNDTVGCCTCSAIGHQVQVWTANAGTEVTISDADIIAAYSAISGYNPQTGANDVGGVCLDVLNYWRKTGVGGHVLGAFAAVAPSNHALVQAAIDLFGGVYVGVGLPMTAQTQSVWDVVGDGRTGNSAPFSWGGHCIVCVDYDAAGLICISWGFLFRLTWAFWDAYVDEAYACLGAEWVTDTTPAPSGFDRAALVRDLAQVAGQPDPGPAPEPTPTPTPTPPPWQPDPTSVAWLQWQIDVANYQMRVFTSGPAGKALAITEQGVLINGATWLLTYLAGQTEAKAPPPLPQAPS